METRMQMILAVPPEDVTAARGHGLTLAHMAYRLGGGPHLFRAGGPTAPRGGLMVVGDRGFDGMGAVGPFCQEVVRECLARGFSGCLLDLEGRLPPLEQLAAQYEPAAVLAGNTPLGREMTARLAEQHQ